MAGEKRVEINGKPMLSIGASAGYLRITTTAMNTNIKRFNDEHPDALIERYKLGFGQEHYLALEDLDRLKAWRLKR